MCFFKFSISFQLAIKLVFINNKLCVNVTQVPLVTEGPGVRKAVLPKYKGKNRALFVLLPPPKMSLFLVCLCICKCVLSLISFHKARKTTAKYKHANNLKILGFGGVGGGACRYER